MSATRVVIAGACGRMGRSLLRLAADDPNIEVIGAVTIESDERIGEDAGQVAGTKALQVPISHTPPPEADVVIEFTTPAGCRTWSNWCRENNAALVSGTTGLDDETRAALETSAKRVPVLWAPNMSVGVSLLLDLVRDLARRTGPDWNIEIVETHHARKQDAPSGTADALLRAASAGRDVSPGDVARHGRSGRSGPRPVSEIGVHALRMGGIVGEHDVHFAWEHEVLTLRHSALNRDVFAAGALKAARWITGRAPGMYGMSDVLAGPP